MTALETLGLVAAGAFIVEVVVLLSLGRDEGDELDALRSWHEHHSRHRGAQRRRSKRRPSKGDPPLGGYRGVG